MMGDVARLLERLFQILLSECPAATTEMARRLRGLSMGVRLGDETFVVVVVEHRPTVRRAAEGVATVVESDIVVVCDLLLGNRNEIDALLAGDLVLTARSSELILVEDFVRLLVAGAARSPSASALLDELLILARRGGGVATTGLDEAKRRKANACSA